MEKSKIPAESRSKMFLRSNSFQKLCSLAHPMSLKGFKSNREALKSVFESLIVTTRGVIQSVTYRILCFLFLTPLTRLVSRSLSIVSGKDGKFNTVRLILKLTLSMIVSTDKDEVKCDANEPSVAPPDEAPVSTKSVVDTGVQTEGPAEETNFPPEQFFDCKDYSAPARPSPQELCSRLLENSLPPAAPACTRRKRLTFGLVVYGCVLCCFVQLSALAYLLNVASSIPPGLIFLISSLSYIGYVMMKIFFDECSSNRTDPTKLAAAEPGAMMVVAVPARSKVRPRASKGKGLHPILAAVGKQVAAVLQSSKLVPINGSPRMSRSATSRNRLLLCADNKTISKMKLF